MPQKSPEGGKRKTWDEWTIGGRNRMRICCLRRSERIRLRIVPDPAAGEGVNGSG
jgi:hypothetical protein